MNGLKPELPYDETLRCVQCGYCLPACPTYMVYQKESASPRGRIALVKAAAEGRMDLLDDLAEPIDLCLGCRACETACPTGVRYGVILEGAKQAIEGAVKGGNRRKLWVRILRRFLFRHLFPYPRRLKLVTGMIWLYQRSGLRKLARQLGIFQRLPFHLGDFESALPDAPSPFAFVNRKREAKARGTKKMKIAFFSGCVMDSLFYETNRKSVELLSALGCDVAAPKGQTCCGALHAHAGETDLAKQLAKRNIEAFEATGADWYVNNAGGCGAMLKEYAHLLQDEPEWAERAKRFSAKCRDISSLLAELGPLPFRREIPARITYQDSCHLRNVQGVASQPREILRAIPGATYVELPGAAECCGSAGIYNLVQYETSMKVLDRKMEAVKGTEAAIVVTSNPGCLLQMRMGIMRANLEDRMRAVHLVDLVYDACGLEGKSNVAEE